MPRPSASSASASALPPERVRLEGLACEPGGSASRTLRSGGSYPPETPPWALREVEEQDAGRDGRDGGRSPLLAERS